MRKATILSVSAVALLASSLFAHRWILDENQAADANLQSVAATDRQGTTTIDKTITTIDKTITTIDKTITTIDETITVVLNGDGNARRIALSELIHLTCGNKQNPQITPDDKLVCDGDSRVPARIIRAYQDIEMAEVKGNIFGDRPYMADLTQFFNDARVNKHKAILPMLTAALHDSNSRVRAAAAMSFYWMSRSGSLDSLIPLLTDNDPDVKQIAAISLDMDISIQFNVSKDCRGYIGDVATRLCEARHRAAHALLAADHDPAVSAGAFRFFVRQKDFGAALVEGMEKFGSKNMALALLNAGNAELVSAATKWTTEHGYSVSRGPSNFDCRSIGRISTPEGCR
jgi:HEAT repeats